MRSQRSSGKPKKRKTLLIRQVVGISMSPTLRAGQLVLATGRFGYVHEGDVVIIWHNGREKIKRVAQVDPNKGMYVLGDNPDESTDSRSFGWLDHDEIIAKVIYPRSLRV
jgi:phage repressor protein C with HTH and peptisase S24 domain